MYSWILLLQLLDNKDCICCASTWDEAKLGPLTVHIKKKIQIFVVNMTFISSHEMEKVFFILMKQTFFTSVDEIKVIFTTKI